MEALLRLSATKLASMIKNREVSAEEVVQTFISQAKRVNPYINAIVKDRYEQAIQEAKEVDLFLKSDPENTPAFLGVPCTIKEQFALKGMPQTFGLVYMRNNVANFDATAVSRLKAAGAIPIGVTNVPVLSLHWETDNKLYGRTNNPYDLERTPGGSSGGEAAMISSAGSAFGLGSDIGGSIRTPASFCGIYGHKSSPGLIPFTGGRPNFPNINPNDLKSDFKMRSYYGVAGPITRFSEDLMPIMKIISGPDGTDPYTKDITLGDVDQVKAPDLNFYYIDHENLHEDVKNAQDKAIKILLNSGAKVKKIDLGKFEYAFEIIWQSLSKSNNPQDMIKLLFDNKPFNLEHELELEKKGLSDLPYYVLMLLSQALSSQESSNVNFIEMGEMLKDELADLLGNDSVLIYPTNPYPALKHGEALMYFKRTAFTAIFNILGCPATCFPTGLSQEGLPIGMQVVANTGNDHLTIAVAKFLEREGLNWIPPKLAGINEEV